MKLNRATISVFGVICLAGLIWAPGCNNDVDVSLTAPTEKQGTPDIPATPETPEPETSPSLTDIAFGNSGGCAIRAGTAYCWGLYALGLTSSTSPVTIPGLPEGQVTHIAAGAHARCAVAAGAAKCWGYIEQYGEWGDGSGGTNDFTGARQVVGLTEGVEAVFLSITGEAACAIQNQALYCWGRTINGESNPTPAFSSTPIHVADLGAGPQSWKGRVSISSSHGCFIKSDNHLYCWGKNDAGQLGTGNQVPSATPIKVTEGPVEHVAVSAISTCAIKNGAVSCWGAATQGQLGNGTTPARSLTPVTPTGLESGVTSLTASYSSFCAVKNRQTYCWGNVAECVYLLPAETHPSPPLCVYHAYVPRSTPVALAELGTGVLQLSAGPYHLCARTADSLLCKGGYGFGAMASATSPTNNRADLVHEIALPAQ